MASNHMAEPGTWSGSTYNRSCKLVLVSHVVCDVSGSIQARQDKPLIGILVLPDACHRDAVNVSLPLASNYPSQRASPPTNSHGQSAK